MSLQRMMNSRIKILLFMFCMSIIDASQVGLRSPLSRGLESLVALNSAADELARVWTRDIDFYL